MIPSDSNRVPIEVKILNDIHTPLTKLFSASKEYTCSECNSTFSASTKNRIFYAPIFVVNEDHPTEKFLTVCKSCCYKFRDTDLFSYIEMYDKITKELSKGEKNQRSSTNRN